MRNGHGNVGYACSNLLFFLAVLVASMEIKNAGNSRSKDENGDQNRE